MHILDFFSEYIVEILSAVILVAVGSIFVYNITRSGIVRVRKPKLSIFGYKTIYSDTKDKFSGKDVKSNILDSEKYGLRGKPDYIFKSKFSKSLIPIELKSGSVKDEKRPYQGDLMQLVAYFLIIEDVYGIRPRQGRIIYKDAMFIVKNSYSLKRELLSTVASMRKMLVTGEGEARPSFIKCRYCICNGTVCEKYTGEN